MTGQYIFITICLFFNLTCTKKINLSENIIHAPLLEQVSTLDPALSYDTVSATILYQSYETLFEYHYLKRPYQLQPLLAQEMPRVENNGKRYIIKIKKNIRYHDDPVFNGRPRFLIAQDFINQIKRLAFLPTKSNGWWLFNHKIKGLNQFRKDAGSSLKKFQNLKVEGLTAKGPHTLIIDLIQPYPQLLYALAMNFATPMPLEAILKYNNNLNNKIIGTGPFRLTEWKKKSRIKLVKFKHYHPLFYPAKGDRFANENEMLKDTGKKLPFLDGITFHIIKENQTRWLNFRKKKLDYIILPKDNYSFAVNAGGGLSKEMIQEGLKLQIAPSLIYWWLAFNMRDKLLGANKNLRLAIAHGVNTEKYIDLFTRNIGQKANSIYPPGVPGYNPANKLPYEYNPKKAAEFLVKAGYPKGVKLPTLKYDVRGTSTKHRQQGAFVKKELAKIGIKIKVSTNTFPAFLKKARSGHLQFWLGGWSMDYPDAENSLQLLASQNHPPGPNNSYYSNKTFDQLFEQLKLLEEGPEKLSLINKLEAIVNADVPWAMLYYTRYYLLYFNHLKNYRYSDLNYNTFKYLRLEKK